MAASVNWLDVVVILAFVLVDDLRNAVVRFLADADVAVLVALMVIAYIAYNSKLAFPASFDLNNFKIPAPKLSLSLPKIF